MKKIFMILVLLLSVTIVFAQDTVPQQPAQTAKAQNNQTQTTQPNPLVTPQNIMFENCTKIYGVNKEKLFSLTLASITANRFTIDEIQTSSGYIIFSANKNKYLATIAEVDGSNSILKITPCNNIYRFPAGIISNTFKYIDLKIAVKG